MKILVDQNISHRLLEKLTVFPAEIKHIKNEGLVNANDHAIFMYARVNQFDAVLTLDDDFVKLLNAYSTPPKIIWIRTRNCSTNYLANLLLNKASVIHHFVNSEEFALYELF